MPTLSKEKSALRKHFLALRAEIAHPQQEIFAQQAADLFLKNIPVKQQDIISGYYPAKSEISPLPLMRDLAQRGHITTLPVVMDKQLPLVFHSWKEGDALHDGVFFEIKEPKSDPAMPTVIIVPLLAFDASGQRLGYGGGFYDRTLHALHKMGHEFIAVGLAYACQQHPALPIHSGDHPLDFVVTQERVFRFSAD